MGRGGGQKRGPLLLFQYSLLQELSIYQSGRKVLDRLAKSVLSRGEQKICSTFIFFLLLFKEKLNIKSPAKKFHLHFLTLNQHEFFCRLLR
jgi:hypothetical protein